MISVMPEAEGKPVRVPIAFPPEMYEWLRETAFKRRAKMAELVREAIQEYRARHEPQLRLPIERDKEE